MTRYPRKVQIETFLGCNARCSYCTVNEWTRTHGQMRSNIFNEAVSQLSDIREHLEAVSLYMDGEPLLDPDLAYRIQLAKYYQLPNVGFSTNGSLLISSKSFNLLYAGLDWISFSLDSTNSEAFESHRKRLNYTNIYNNIMIFIKLRDSGNYKTSIQLRHMNNGIQSFDEYYAYWKPFLRTGDMIQSLNVHNWSNKPKTVETKPLIACSYIQDNLVILNDGTVPLCCVDYNAEITLGNIMHEHLLDIWNNPQYNTIRKFHSSGQRNKVKNCGSCNIPEEIATQQINERL